MSYPRFSSDCALVGQEVPLATVATVRLPIQESVATVATVAASPSANNACNGGNTDPETVLARAIREAEDCQAYFEERAAIREYDGGLPRNEAERLAVEDTLTHYFGPNLAAKGTK